MRKTHRFSGSWSSNDSTVVGSRTSFSFCDGQISIEQRLVIHQRSTEKHPSRFDGSIDSKRFYSISLWRKRSTFVRKGFLVQNPPNWTRKNDEISFQGDREQFNQCQTQLEILYDSGCNREHLNEFLVYRLLYSLLLNDHKSEKDKILMSFSLNSFLSSRNNSNFTRHRNSEEKRLEQRKNKACRCQTARFSCKFVRSDSTKKLFTIFPDLSVSSSTCRLFS